MEECVNVEICNMLENGIIEPSESPYSAPIELERKVGHIFCIDYRKLSVITEF